MATIETETTNVLPAASSHPLAETTTSTNRNSDHLQTTNTTTNTTTTAANTTIYMSTTITTIISSAVEDLSLSLSTRDDSVPPSPLNLLDTQSSPLLSSTSLLSSATTSSSIISTKPSVISTPTAPSIIDTSTTCSFLTSILSTSDTLSSYTQSSSVPSPSSSFTTTILPSNESSSSLIPAAVIQSTATTSLTPKEQANSYEEELSASPPSSTLSNIIEETIQPDLPRPVDGVIVKEEEENEITRNSAIGISDNIINLIEQGNEQDEAGSGDGASHGGDEGGISVIDLIDPFRREGKEETAIAAEGVVEEKELRLDQYIQDHGINSGGKEEEVVVDVEVATTTSIIVEIQVDASSDSSQGGIVAAVESERNVVTDRVSSLPHESSSSRTGDLMSSTVPSSVVGDLVFDNASSVFLDKDDAGNVITSSSPKQQQPEEGVGRDSHQQSNTPTTSSTSSSNQQEQALPSSSSQQQQQQSSSYTIFAKPQHSSATTRFNYASFDCGARILAHTPNAKTPHAILLSSKDQYMLQRCNTGTTSTTTTNKFVVIELCQEILVDTLRMANFEFFSSMFKGVRVSVTSVYTGAHQPLAATTGGDGGELGKDGEWVLLGDFQALNVRVMQV